MAEVQSGNFSNEDCLVQNTETLRELCRLLSLSLGDFELILAVCNSSQQRQSIVQQFQQNCPVTVQSITLEPSTTTLFTTIQKQVQLPTAEALMVFGLDTIQDLDPLLTATNQIREEFRHFPFPIILWLTNDTLKQLIRLAPDFYTWANTFTFYTPSHVFTDFLDKLIQDLWHQVKDARENDFLDKKTLGLASGSPRCQELEMSRTILDHRGITLTDEQLASLSFLQGRISNNNTLAARDHYEESLKRWQDMISVQTNDETTQARWQERQGYVQFYLGLWWLTRAARYQREVELAYEKSHLYFQQAVETFDHISQLDRVAHIINFLADLLHRRKLWPKLAEVATRASSLHSQFGNPIRQARAESFLAEVDLAKTHFALAQRRAEKAMHLIQPFSESKQAAASHLTQRDAGYYAWVNSFQRSWYLFSLGKAQLGQHQVDSAILTFEKALSVTQPEYDPDLYRQVLASLRQGYREKGQYLEAFETRCQKETIESQFNFLAFIGAGRLQPTQQVNNSVLPDNEVPQDLIAASGRKSDVQRLLTRLQQDEFKLTIIYGPSGVGKSSLIEAGLLPALSRKRLDNRRVLTLHLRLYSDWVRECVAQLNTAIARLQMTTTGQITLHGAKNDGTVSASTPEELLQRLQEQTSTNKAIVLILDQFEEFFFEGRQATQRQKFYEFLRDCLRSPYIKIILALREDHTHYLLECNRLANLDIVDNNILSKKWLYFLGNFTPQEATTVFKDLTKKTPFDPESTLIDYVVDELSEEFGEVRPIELQLIGSQLQRDGITTLKKYQQQATQGASTKQILIQRYITNVVDECGPEANQQLARLTLYLLTDEKITRPIKTIQSLLRDLDILINTPKFGKKELTLALSILTKSGLIVRVNELSEPHYQLVHDYISKLVRQQYKPESSGLIESLDKQLQQAEEQAEENKRELSQVLKGRARAYAIVIAFAFLSILAVVFGLRADSQKKQLAIAEIKTLNSVAEAHLQPRNQLDALLASVKAGEKVQIFPKSSQLREETLKQLERSFHNIRSINRLDGHTAKVLSVGFDPTGERLVSSSADGYIHLWSSDGTLLKEISTVSKSIDTKKAGTKEVDIRAVSFSSDGNLFVSASADGVLRVWDKEGNLLNHFKGHEQDATSVVFHPTKERFASAGGDGTVSSIKIWNVNGSLLESFEAYQDSYINSLAFNSDGKMLVAGGGDKKIKIWTVDGNLIGELEGHKDVVWDIQFSPDDQMIASASSDKTVKIWNRSNQSWEVKTTLNAHGDRVLGISFSPDGQTIASSSVDETIKLWNLDGQVLETLRGHETGVRDVTFNPQGNLLASAGLDRTIRLWHKDTWELTLQGHEEELRSIEFSPDGAKIVTSSQDETVKLWTSEGKLIKSQSFEHRIVNLDFSSDGSSIIGASADGSIKILTLNSDKISSRMTHNEAVWDVKYHPQEDIFISGGESGIVEIWEGNGHLKQKIDNAHQDAIYSLDFSPKGNLFASGSSNGEIKFWDMNGLALGTIDSGQNLEILAFSPDGKYLASAGSIENIPLIKLWNLNGELVNQFKGHDSLVISLAFNTLTAELPLLASGDIGGKIILWNYKKGGRLQTLQDLGLVWDLSFSPDGMLLASASDHRQGKIWALNTEQLNALLPGDLEALLKGSCTWLANYISTNKNVGSEDSEPCQKINATISTTK